MADEELVPGHGYVSDDSSFYGPEEEQQRQSELCGEFDAEQLWRTHSKDINATTMNARAPLLAENKRTARQASSGDALPPKSAVEATALTVKDASFTISGPNRKAMGQERLARLGERNREPSPEQSPTLKLFNPLQGRPDAWQLGEPVDDFVRRLPPFITSIFTCPWIWAGNPHRNPRDKSPCPRVDDFTTRGTALLEQYLDTRHDFQKAGAGQPRGIVNRQLNQESKALQERITSLVKETHVLSGKWMLFPKSVDVTRVWKQIVAGTINNSLGSSCKVATDDGNEERLVCVYTKDFQDTADVSRVLQELEKIGVFSGRTIYYKPDVYTYLDLRRESAAQYGLQASLYNSRTMGAGSKTVKSEFLPKKKQSMLDSYL